MATNKMSSGQNQRLKQKRSKGTATSNRGAYFADMKKQNDSLRKLPKNDKHHIPSFDISTKKGQADKIKFYTQDGSNQKLRDLRKLGAKLRKKHKLGY